MTAMVQMKIYCYYRIMKNRGRLIVSVSGRITLFLFVFTIFIMILYIQGNFQDFIDDSLIKLLLIYRYTVLAFLAFAAAYIFILVIAGKMKAGKLIRRIVFTVIGILLSSVLFFMVEIIITGLEPVI